MQMLHAVCNSKIDRLSSNTYPKNYEDVTKDKRLSMVLWFKRLGMSLLVDDNIVVSLFILGEAYG